MIPECEICHTEMILDKRLPNHKTKTGICRVRRFKCPVCDYKIVIYADGERDLEFEPELAIKAVDKFHKQETENRN